MASILDDPASFAVLLLVIAQTVASECGFGGGISP
jgi:hypothetical protein